MRKVLSLLAAPVFLLALESRAEKKAAPASFTVLESTQQTSKPRGETTSFTIYRFRIIWNSSSAPAAFFWRPSQNTWMETNSAKPYKRPGLAPGDYMIVEKNIALKDIKKGDTILLATHRHSHEDIPMPAEVKTQPVNNLYYQVGTNKTWKRTAISIRKLPDLNY